MKHLFLLAVTALFLSFCTQHKPLTLEPKEPAETKPVTLESGNIKAIFTDNTAFNPNHREGYNGIAELYHHNQDSSLFVPAFAGFNLEHIFSGDSLEQFFEPRVNPMSLYKKNDTEVLLYQRNTPVSGVESLTEFKLLAPHYIDITFRCILHNNDYFKHGYAGFFWASYIHKPSDKKIYFKGIGNGITEENWISAFSEEHGLKSTHKHISDNNNFFFIPGFRARLANHYSDYRFTKHFYFGRFHNMSMAYFFDSTEIIRFTQSPTGGGETNPAWDFQFLIPSPETGKEYSFKARIVYKPFQSREDIEQEYEKWKDQN